MSGRSRSSYVLTQLDVYNWGAFGGRHRADIDPAGTAIIGPTGSGKTTLVDALMTLLVDRPRYNLASTGGHDSDRDLASYVRGVAGTGASDADTSRVARPDAVVSAIAVRLDDGETALRIGAVFWFDGTSSAAADLKKRWLFCTGDEPTFDEWLERYHDGGAGALGELERTRVGCKVYRTKQSFLARLRGYFEVGENAFALLNRASGLKQLDSIDKVFRELVLDDHSAFARAAEVAAEFDTLAGIRAELETARQQRNSLTPVAAQAKALAGAEAERERVLTLQRLLPAWCAERARVGWLARRDGLTAERQRLAAAVVEIARRIEGARRAVEAAHADYLRAGGASIEQIRAQIETQDKLVATRRRAARDYEQRAQALGLDATLTESAVAATRIAAKGMQPQRTDEATRAQQAAFDAGIELRTLEGRLAELQGELAEARERPGSNIPRRQHQFRHALAQELGVSDEDLPFVAELVEVRAEEQRWRGAIERALGGERLRLLVDPAHAGRALRWVNARDQHTRVRLHEAAADAAPAPPFADGFVRKLNSKPHRLQPALQRLIAGLDRHCVEDAETLRATPHAMTAEGLLSGRRHFFDKDDRAPLGADWMTGFDNRDRIAALAAGIAKLAGPLAAAGERLEEARRRADADRNALRLLDELIETEFADVDLPGAQKAVDDSRQRLAALTAPTSDAIVTQQRWEGAKAALEALRTQDTRLQTDVQIAARQLEEADATLERLAARIGAGLADAERAQADARWTLPDDLALERYDEWERAAAAALQDGFKAAVERCGMLGKRLVAAMKDAQRADTGALAEAGCEIQDVPAYLERLQVLEREALPEKLKRFRTYLNQSSDQGVTQLLSEVDNEVSEIEERIAELNATLERVNFQPGHYLRLEPQRVQHESLRTLRQARATLRSAELKDDEGESHYAALARVVALLRDAAERSKTQGAQALLDPRYRLQFAVLVIARADGQVLERRTSSQGGSGGEKEIIASYVLTASLSYALCPRGGLRPLFATIVLDEAFSKSSQAVAGRIIRALAEFGLHPLFVTPNKELRLLRAHTRSAIVVHRKASRAALVSLSWEALDEHAKARAAARAGAAP